MSPADDPETAASIDLLVGKFSEEQRLKILREADRLPVGELAKEHGISEETIDAWRKRFGKLEAENAKLKELGSERDLDRCAARGRRKKW